MHTDTRITATIALTLIFLPSCSPLRYAAGSRQEEAQVQESRREAVRDTSFALVDERLVQTVVEYFPIVAPEGLADFPDSAAIAGVPAEVLPEKPRQLVKSVTRTEYGARSEAAAARESVAVDTIAVNAAASEEEAYEDTERKGSQGSVKTSFVSVAVVAVCLLLIVAILKFKK